MARGLQAASVDLVLAAILQDLLTQSVLPHQAARIKGEGSSEPGQVDQHVVGRAARSLSFTPNIGKLLRLRINID